MSKFMSIILTVGLLIVMFMAIFQGDLGRSYNQQGSDITNEIDNISVTDQSRIGR